jgi:hypothetical protein
MSTRSPGIGTVGEPRLTGRRPEPTGLPATQKPVSVYQRSIAGTLNCCLVHSSVGGLTQQRVQSRNKPGKRG